MSDLTRAFVLDEWEFRSGGDGRTVEGRIIPYNEVGHVIERDDNGQLVEFDEQFLPGSCAAMAQACRARGNASFVSFHISHDDDDFDKHIGHAADLREANDGAYATFRLYESKDIDKVRSMLHESHKGLSVKFKAVRTPKLIDNVVSHVQVAIGHVAATAIPVYSGARIMAMREHIDDSPVFATPHLDSVKAMLDELRRVPA